MNIIFYEFKSLYSWLRNLNGNGIWIKIGPICRVSHLLNTRFIFSRWFVYLTIRINISFQRTSSEFGEVHEQKTSHQLARSCATKRRKLLTSDYAPSSRPYCRSIEKYFSTPFAAGDCREEAPKIARPIGFV